MPPDPELPEGVQQSIKGRGREACVWPAGLLPDDCQGDEVHQEGHDGHVRGPVGVVGPQGPCCE